MIEFKQPSLDPRLNLNRVPIKIMKSTIEISSLINVGNGFDFTKLICLLIRFIVSIVMSFLEEPETALLIGATTSHELSLPLTGSSGCDLWPDSGCSRVRMWSIRSVNGSTCNSRDLITDERIDVRSERIKRPLFAMQ